MHYPQSVIVTDFDGTITHEDFYKLAVERLLTPQDLGPWDDYRAGEISHFTAIQRIFAKIYAPEEAVFDIIRDMGVAPGLSEYAKALKEAGWHVVVASAGCEWYIRIILDSVGVTFEVHSNPGTYHPGGPLEMNAPQDSPFYSLEDGVDKAGIVQYHLDHGATVVYAGDGFTDLNASLLVPSLNRFARSDLADALSERGVPFKRFHVWTDVAKAVLNGEIQS